MPTEESNAKPRLKILGFNFEHDYPISMILFDQIKQHTWKISLIPKAKRYIILIRYLSCDDILQLGYFLAEQSVQLEQDHKQLIKAGQ